MVLFVFLFHEIGHTHPGEQQGAAAYWDIVGLVVFDTVKGNDQFLGVLRPTSFKHVFIIQEDLRGPHLGGAQKNSKNQVFKLFHFV